MYAIKNEINIKKGDYIEKNDIYTLIGIDIKGYRQFLNIYQDRVNNNRFWLDCFESLKSRGLKNILFLSVDDNRNMKMTAKIAFPDIIFVDSLADLVPKFYKYSQNIRFLLFKHSANMEFYDRIRLSFNSNNNYITEFEEIYDKLGTIDNYFGFISFKKREWLWILNDIIQLYSKIDFI